jgi:hypothetical protein
VNRAYAELGAHYRTAVVPARPRKPRDKSKVEVGVQIAQRWILARIRIGQVPPGVSISLGGASNDKISSFFSAE